MNTTTVKPYTEAQSGKKVQVEQMFDAISPQYDAFNHMMTMGIDYAWRRKAVKLLKSYNPKRVLDVATGTGDFAIEAVKILKPEHVVGLDISEGMLEVGRKKMKERNYDKIVSMVKGDSEQLPFENESFEAITVGFGVRNFENLEQGLAEIRRVLHPKGAVAILEPAYPTAFPLKQLFSLYFKGIIPTIGRIFAQDKAAYTYLPNSVKAFPNGKEFLTICNRVGFSNGRWIPLTFGVCSLYILEK